jgi:hypothetical protein
VTLDWRIVFEGDVWRVKILQAELDGLGIATFVPDPYVPSQDPHFSGTPTAASALFVSSDDVERATEIVRKSPKAR